MFALKNYYYIYIENTKDLNLNSLKIREKFSIVYRSKDKNSDLYLLFNFRKKCSQKGILFFVANDIKLAYKLKADGLYLSSFNKKLNILSKKKKNFLIIGSAHSFREYFIKTKQGCTDIILSRLFKTDYKGKKGFLGVLTFNFFTLMVKKKLTPLGGIRLGNLNSLKNVRSNSFAIMSEIKKKPAIANRLF